jgi:hypothetical protein
MKIKSLFIAVLLMAGVVVAPTASASERPTVESFTFSPQEIDLTASNTEVTFEATVSHPLGIEDNSLTVTLTNNKQFNFLIFLSRVAPLTSSLESKVTFKGSLTLPRNMTPGVYTPQLSSARNIQSTNYQYESGVTEPKNFRSLVGAENDLLVRTNGNLEFDFKTFVGPSHDSSVGNVFTNRQKFNSGNIPLWNVGETYDPSIYFEFTVPSLKLEISSSTPSVCVSDGLTLKFVQTGGCSFDVFTKGSRDYLETRISQAISVQPARSKPNLSINTIKNQDTKDLGKVIDIGSVYSVVDGYVIPKSLTPSICFPSGIYLALIAGGTCKLTYQSSSNSSFLASDLYTVSFDILKDGQPVVAPTPVVTPTPVATPTAKPVVKKTITCVKGTKTIKKTAVSPKCPKGYKLKK